MILRINWLWGRISGKSQNKSEHKKTKSNKNGVKKKKQDFFSPRLTRKMQLVLFLTKYESSCHNLYSNHYTLLWCTEIFIHCHDVLQSLYIVMMYCNHYTSWCTGIFIHLDDVLQSLYIVINIHRHDVLQSLYIVMMYFYTSWCTAIFIHLDDVLQSLYIVMYIHQYTSSWCTAITIHRPDDVLKQTFHVKVLEVW